MAQSLEQINAVRVRLGQEPLTELPAAAPAEALKEEEKKPEVKEEKKPEEKPLVVAAELTDDAVLQFLQKKGLNVSSFEDLNKPVTEADLEKQAEQRENEKFTYGLNKGLFNRKTHEQFILDRNNKKDLVFAQYYQQAKKDDPNLTDEEIQGEYAAKFGLDAEPETRKYKRGMEEIEILGEIILKNRYANIYKLDTEFDTYENTTKQQKALEAKIKIGTPTFRKDVDEVFVDLKKITTKIGDEESYEVEVLDEAITSLKEKFLDSNFIAQQISKGYTKEEIKDIAFTALLKENWPVIAKEMINQALYNKQKGVKGILPVGEAGKQPVETQLTENQQKALKRNFPNQQPVGAN